MSGVITTGSSGASGGQFVRSIHKGDWVKYQIVTPTSGVYRVSYQISTPKDKAILRFKTNKSKRELLFLPFTWGNQRWETISHRVWLEGGAQTATVSSKNQRFDIDSLEVS